MTLLAASQIDAALPDRLGQRLRALGLAAFRLRPGERPAPLSPVGNVEELLLRSAIFARATWSAWTELEESGDPLVPLWPGLWLAPLGRPTSKRKRGERLRRPIVAAVLVGPEFLGSEQFRAVCDELKLDARAAVSRVDASRLLAAADAPRVAAMLAWMHDDAAEIDRRLDDLQGMSKELASSYEELSLLYKLSTSLTVTQPADQFLGDACRELQTVVGLRWLALQLVEDEPRLQDLAGRLVIAGPVADQRDALRAIGRELISRFGAAQQPLVVDDTARLGIPGLAELSTSLLVVPLRSEGRPLAILFGADKVGSNQITSGDSKLCDSLANSLTIFLQNTMLYEDVQAMFLGTLHALTSAIDAKDSYTHGHSERVALLSRMLAQAVGLDDHAVERVYISGMVHDVGKIGVPESVLTKPGKLTDAEFAQIKLHPQIGARILQDIRQMHDLIPGVLYHHEQWSGSGYPFGLKGESIPIFGRVIGLADAFDAMSSDRTYRKGMSLERVLGEIERCAGRQFDPDLAKAFLALDLTPYLDAMRRLQRQADRASDPEGLARA